jgi:hypothetical protein
VTDHGYLALVTSLSAPLAIGAVLLADVSTARAQASTGQVSLLGADVRPEGIAFRVRSGGCTSKAHFGLEMVKRDPLTVRLLRIRPDYCEANVPEGTKVSFTFAEIGAGPILTKSALRDVVIVNNRP